MRYFLLILVLVALHPRAAAQRDVPRPEHPRPQFERAQWLNLNGEWDFTIDASNTGRERGFATSPEVFDRQITVPFPPESRLSGIAHKDFMDAVWYLRNFTVPADWDGQRVFLHFGGSDYATTVWVNDEEVGTHYGGSVSFEFEVTDALRSGDNTVVVQAVDDIRSGVQPNGKQSVTYANDGCCNYTRVTGIWQTVWLEARPQAYLVSVQVLPDLDNSRFTVRPVFDNISRDHRFRVTLSAGGGAQVLSQAVGANNGLVVTLPLDDPRVWSPENPQLYDLTLELLDGEEVVDRVESYAGLRKIHTEGNRIFLNNEPIFLRFVLDQGFYPEGIWTAPSDEALKQDIELSMSVGFNGARLHQKLFEERFHYWADRLGYLTWAEFPDWGAPQSYAAPESLLNHEREWRESILRDRNHPSIIAWTPLNETHSMRLGMEEYSRAVRDIYDLTKALDPSRPVNTTSGWLHVVTDIWTVHDYAQLPERLEERYASLPDSAGYYYPADWVDRDMTVRGSGYDLDYGTYPERIPFVMDEYGGTFWTQDYTAESARGNGRQEWGYGKTQAEVEDRIDGLTRALLDNPHVFGYVYTQLTDVEQEVNGVFTYDRRPKFDLARLREIFAAPAAAEGASH